MSTRTTALNDVDLDSVASLTAAIGDDPGVASTTWRARVDWTGGFRSEAKVRHFAPVLSDEPPALGGTDTAPNPVEQLLAALGNCLAVGYAANASAAGITLDALSIELAGDLDLHTFLGLGAGNAGYSAIGVVVHLEADADPSALAALHDKVVATSPVGHTLNRAVPVEIILDRTPGGGAD